MAAASISAVFAEAFEKASESLCSAVRNELAAIPQVSKVSINNLTGRTGRVKAEVKFTFGGAKVRAWLDNSCLRCDNIAGFSDIRFTGVHSTVNSMIAEVSKSYILYLKEYAKRIATLEEKYDHVILSRKQRLLMLQQEFIDAEFDAKVKVLANGAFRLMISHPAAKATLLEVEVKA